MAKATCMSESGTPDPGRDIPEEEAPLITEIRRVYEIQKQLLHERAEKELALLERREKKWYWRAWWSIEWWFRDLFRKMTRARPRPTSMPASNSGVPNAPPGDKRQICLHGDNQT